MPQYDAGVLVDGWLLVRLTAPNYVTAKAQLQHSKLHLAVLDEANNIIGEVVPDMSVVEVEIEDIESNRPSKPDRYHAPVMAEPGFDPFFEDKDGAGDD